MNAYLQPRNHLDDIGKLGAALGRQWAARFARSGASPEDERLAHGIEAEAVEEMERALKAISRRVGPEEASKLFRALRASMPAEIARDEAFTAEGDAHDAAIEAQRAA